MYKVIIVDDEAMQKRMLTKTHQESHAAQLMIQLIQLCLVWTIRSVNALKLKCPTQLTLEKTLCATLDQLQKVLYKYIHTVLAQQYLTAKQGLCHVFAKVVLYLLTAVAQRTQINCFVCVQAQMSDMHSTSNNNKCKAT